MRRRSLGLTEPHPHVYARFLQERCAAPIYPGVGVYDRNKALRDSGVYQRIGARGSLAVMAAGLQSDISCCAARLATCDLQRNGLRMGAAAVLSRALADNLPVFDEQTSDGRIFCRATGLPRAEFKRALFSSCGVEVFLDKRPVRRVNRVNHQEVWAG